MPAKHARSAAVTLGCLGAGLVIIGFQHRYGLGTATVDRAALRDWLSGGDLYAFRPGTTLPPPAALLLAPLAVLPLALAGGLIALAGLAALVLALIALAGPVARRYGKSRGLAVAVAVVLALAAEPVRATIGLGSLDLVLFGLVTADVVALRRSAWARSRAAWWPGRPASSSRAASSSPPVSSLWSASSLWPASSSWLRRGWATGAWAGLGTGIATALAVSPIIFIAYFAISRQWRAFVTATATTAALFGGALLMAPNATVNWLFGALPELDRAGPLDAAANQSLAGVLARLYDSSSTPVLIWLSFAGLLFAVGMIRARSAHADGDEIAAFTLVGLTGAAVGPVSRLHELIWLVPATLILLDAAARLRVTARRFRTRRRPGTGHAIAAGLLFVLVAVSPRWTAWWNGYAFALILLLNALPWRPGVAPALPVRRRPQPIRRAAAIPGPRGR
jgi:alpha-1,2-mannosyltransferase